MDITIQLLFLLSFFATLIPASFGFKCYVCSWSPKDPLNRTDNCSAGKFKANEIYVHDCKTGCETYVYWDKNGVLEQSRRNCMDSETPLTNDCVSEENKAHSWKRCTCATDLCNSAMSYTSLPSVIFSALLGLTIMLQIHKYVQ